MTIADKIRRAKADYDAVYEAGKASGGGRHTQCFDGTFEGVFEDTEIKALRYGAFAGCGGVTKVSLPNCEEIKGNYVFYDMDSVEEISLPKLAKATSFGAIFNNCGKVKTIDLRSLGGVTLDSNCFRYCAALETLIFGGTAINTLANTNVLGGTPATMSIYVPDALYDEYIAHSSWASYVSRIKKRSVLGV